MNGQNADTNVQNRVVTCFRYGKVEHMISECRWANGACFSCGQVGHLANSCNNSQLAGCRRCGGLDHWVRDCPQGVRMMRTVCGNCGQEGHFARMCGSPRSACTHCGKVGHLSGRCWHTRRTGNLNQGGQIINNSQINRSGITNAEVNRVGNICSGNYRSLQH